MGVCDDLKGSEGFIFRNKNSQGEIRLKKYSFKMIKDVIKYKEQQKIQALKMSSVFKFTFIPHPQEYCLTLNFKASFL